MPIIQSKILILILCFITWHLFSHWLTDVDGLGFNFQKFCVEAIDSKSKFNNLHRKIICSYDQSPFDTNEEQLVIELFRNLGLIHLLVASGAHLNIIQSGVQNICIRYTKSKTPIYIILTVFILCSNFNCPVTRSYCQFIIGNESKKKSMGWSPINTTWISSLFYLSLFPTSIFSLSFWLSMTASLCLCLFSKNITTLSIGFYFCLLPFIFDFNWPTLSSIFVNVFITPWLSAIFIWNSMIYIVFKSYYIIGDYFYIFSTELLKNISNPKELQLTKAILNLKTYKFLYGLLFLTLAIYFQKLRTISLSKQQKIN